MKNILAIFLISLSASAEPFGYVENRILLKLKPQADAVALIAANGGRHIGSIHQIGVQAISVDPAELFERLESLQKNPNVEFAQLDYGVEPDFTPNDTSYGSQWYLPKIVCPTAWDITQGITNIIIAILDTGCSVTHSDLAGNAIAGWDTYNNTNHLGDVYGHGTKVAGTAVAVGNNANGIASVAFKCKLMPIRISDLSGNAYSSTTAAGLTWSSDHGARVANISYQFTADSVVTAAAEYFQTNGNGIVTMSSGNNGYTLTTPDNPYIMTIGATDSSDAITSWSNRGPLIDLVAPGNSIYTTVWGNTYGTASGTSFSAPIVAGAAALVMSANPSLAYSDVEAILESNAHDLGAAGWDSSYGWGRVDAAAAVYDATDLNTGLVAHWNMDETSGTRADNEPTGTAQNLTDVHTVTSATGIIGNAGRFTAANTESLTHADSADLSTGTSTSFSIVAWVKPYTLIGPGASQKIVAKDGSTREYGMDFSGYSNLFHFYTGRSGTSTLDQVFANNFGPPSTNNWYMVAATHDVSTGLNSISVNGSMLESASFTTGPADSTMTFYIGGLASTYFWDGLIDDVWFYKIALSQAQINKLYSLGVGVTCCPSP